MIQKLSKIAAWFAFCLNVNKIQPPKYMGNIRDPIFLDLF